MEKLAKTSIGKPGFLILIEFNATKDDDLCDHIGISTTWSQFETESITKRRVAVNAPACLWSNAGLPPSFINIITDFCERLLSSSSSVKHLSTNQQIVLTVACRWDRPDMIALWLLMGRAATASASLFVCFPRNCSFLIILNVGLPTSKLVCTDYMEAAVQRNFFYMKISKDHISDNIVLHQFENLI